MPFDHIAVSLSDLQATSSQFNGRAAELEQLLSLVQNEIQSLSSTWQGQAAADFSTLMAKWTSDVRGINEVLTAVSQHLAQASTGYGEADTGIARGFQIQ
jgi:WXG100 family type VII secretion target